MASWLKRQLSGRNPEQIKRRAQRLQRAELLDWADACTYAIGRSMSEYRQAVNADAPRWLENAHLEAQALLVLLEEARERLK